MSPEFGSTCAIFPIDEETLRYLEFTGRPKERIALVEAYAKEQGLWHDETSEDPTFSDLIELDLGDVVPSIAGPRRPQDRVSITEAQVEFREALQEFAGAPDDEDRRRDRKAGRAARALDRRGRRRRVVPVERPARRHRARQRRRGRDRTTRRAPTTTRTWPSASRTATPVTLADGTDTELDHGHVVIAAITSCTNTSNPSVMLAAGLLARNAIEKGLETKPWVKTSLAPGSLVVTEYYDRAGLTEPLEQLGFHLVGYGCTTCIGNSGPLPEEVSAGGAGADLAVSRSCRATATSRGASTPT